ncbi:MAG: electron transfer flavoprotein subunit alpha/FixB family protein [Tetrasphaera sp.]|nr:electron transfer flavoprotein subunit alpha/FixB family protein [Tetrasphaera sp.]
MILVLVEIDDGALALVSQEALTFARGLGEPVEAVVLAAPGTDTSAAVADCAVQGVARVHLVDGPDLISYAAAAWASVVAGVLAETGASTLVASGSGRASEILAHVAARLDVPMAANALEASPVGESTEAVGGQARMPDQGSDTGTGLLVRRQVLGGAVVESTLLAAVPAILTVAGHAVEPVAAPVAGAASVVTVTPRIEPDDLRAQVASVTPRSGGDGASLTKAKVVVGAGRGAGGPDGFGGVDALAAKLGGVVGVSRVVTSLGWRPHHEQVGQTGSRINPDLYVPCGISGAIQHWAGCSSSKTIIAINTDAEAPMVTKAAYAIVGDMHEVIPAILAALDKRG